MKEKDSNSMSEKEELEMLRLENQQKEHVSRELDRLWEVFPDIKIEDMPDEVWELVEKGETLLGAYCITLTKKAIEERAATEKNAENSLKTPPAVKNSGDTKQYFTRDEVSKMTRDQVRKNYDRIVDSMKHWN
ncbi:MAG: hypothetical protein E7588_10060 [Ruminococcaceae bacterium]|nr:hypothetical protein [Oscillospiraceae bacterium]